MLDVQWNMCIMDTLGPAKKCPDYQGVLIFLDILSYKMTFGTSTKCLDYAGILNFSSVHINRFQCMCLMIQSLL